MRKIILLVILSLSFILSETIQIEQSKIKKGNFLDKVSSDDPKIQLEMDKLKKQFQSEKTTLDNYYKQKHENLKKQKKIEVKKLKKQFKKRLNRLEGVRPKSNKKNKMRFNNKLNEKPSKIKSLGNTSKVDHQSIDNSNKDNMILNPVSKKENKKK